MADAPTVGTLTPQQADRLRKLLDELATAARVAGGKDERANSEPSVGNRREAANAHEGVERIRTTAERWIRDITIAEDAEGCPPWCGRGDHAGLTHWAHLARVDTPAGQVVVELRSFGFTTPEVHITADTKGGTKTTLKTSLDQLATLATIFEALDHKALADALTEAVDIVVGKTAGRVTPASRPHPEPVREHVV